MNNIETVVAEIVAIGIKIIDLESEIGSCSAAAIKKVLRREKEQLRKKEGQLRKKEEQLREEKLILLRLQQTQNHLGS